MEVTAPPVPLANAPQGGRVSAASVEQNKTIARQRPPWVWIGLFLHYEYAMQDGSGSELDASAEVVPRRARQLQGGMHEHGLYEEDEDLAGMQEEMTRML